MPIGVCCQSQAGLSWISASEAAKAEILAPPGRQVSLRRICPHTGLLRMPAPARCGHTGHERAESDRVRLILKSHGWRRGLCYFAPTELRASPGVPHLSSSPGSYREQARKQR